MRVRTFLSTMGLLVTASVVLAGADPGGDADRARARDESGFRLRVRSVDKEKGTVAASAGEGQQVVHLRVKDAALLGRLKAGDEVEINLADKTVSVVVKVPLEVADAAGGKGADALARAKDEAREALCRNRLRQVGLSLLNYAASYKGRFPADLGALVKDEFLETDPAIFVCPTKERAVPKDFNKLDPEKKAKWVLDNTSYGYNGAGKKDSVASDTVLVYEKSGNHPLPLVTAVFADGHLEVLTPEKWARLVEKDPGLQRAGAGKAR